MSEVPKTPASSTRPSDLRPNIGIQPSEIVGRTVHRLRKSASHPTVTIEFTDGQSFQVRIDGYDPQYPGIPKLLEMDSSLQELLSSPHPLNLEITDCAFITLSDKAFQRSKKRGDETVIQYWDQQHLALALKFASGREGGIKWHCIWASMQECDGVKGDCTFRSYEDVYLERLPQKKSPKQSRRQSRLLP